LAHLEADKTHSELVHGPWYLFINKINIRFNWIKFSKIELNWII